MKKRIAAIWGGGAMALLLLSGCNQEQAQGPGDEVERLAKIKQQHLTCAEVLHLAVPDPAIDCDMKPPEGVYLMPAAPVCGVDGRTYSGHCMAAKYHVEVAYVGDCIARPDTCGQGQDTSIVIDGPISGDTTIVIDDPISQDTSICIIPKPDVDIPDAEDPDACPSEKKRVCGIDGITYDNRCLAEKSTTVAHVGECFILGQCPPDKDCRP